MGWPTVKVVGKVASGNEAGKNSSECEWGVKDSDPATALKQIYKKVYSPGRSEICSSHVAG